VGYFFRVCRLAALVATNPLENPAERAATIRPLLAQLPARNLALLRPVFAMLAAISQGSAVNGMTAANLGVCVGQSLMWPQRVEDVLKNEVPPFVTFVVEHADEVFAPLMSDDGPEEGRDDDAGSHDSVEWRPPKPPMLPEWLSPAPSSSGTSPMYSPEAPTANVSLSSTAESPASTVELPSAAARGAHYAQAPRLGADRLRSPESARARMLSGSSLSSNASLPDDEEDDEENTELDDDDDDDEELADSEEEDWVTELSSSGNARSLDQPFRTMAAGGGLGHLLQRPCILLSSSSSEVLLEPRSSVKPFVSQPAPVNTLSHARDSMALLSEDDDDDEGSFV
jgi:hypothetical protein